ncbi:MAG: hypothetical protein CVV02_14580 [Firmicutes bacterium HGW-Firmicutes-7]|nr:MAG: hypothetical protein CVV02_14580 [Firmicutes bacterium HGW-Firmicutes-7]
MKNSRLYYIDWLRISVILSLIPYHAALTYTGLGDIYIIEPVTGLKLVPFIFLTMPLDNFFMTMLFFISGISSYYSMKSRPDGLFIRERVNKLLKPFLLGTIFLSPVQAYSKALFNGFDGSLIEFIPEFFSKRIVYYLGYAHLWFLLYLFVFSVVSYPLFRWCLINRDRVKNVVDMMITKQYIYFPILWIIAVEAVFRPYFPGMQTLIMDWANNLVYLTVYVFGFIYAFDSRIQDRIELLLSKSIIMVSVSGVSLFFIYWYWLIGEGNNFLITRIWALSKGIYESFLIVLLMVIGRRCFNVDNKVLRYFKESSFNYYLYHMLAVTYITLAFTSLRINYFVKYLMTVVLSVIIMAIVHEVIKKGKTHFSVR